MAFTCGHQATAAMGLIASAASLCAADPHQYPRTVSLPARRDARLAGSGLFVYGTESRTLWQSAAGRSTVLRGRSTGGEHPRRTCSALIGDEESTAPSDVLDPSGRTSDSSASGTTTLKVVPPTLIDQLLTRLQPYRELARFDALMSGVGALLFWPYCWGAGLAAKNGSGPDWKLQVVFGIASYVLHFAVIIINDLFDKDFDAKVERCKQRPFVTGAVTPLQGLIFFGALILLYLASLWQLEAFSGGGQGMQVLLALQLLFNITYPLAKRWTHWTPVYLGLTLNWGVALGWAAVRGPPDLVSSAAVVLLTVVAGCCWTLVYETIYAHLDIKDDVQAGVKSLPVVLGKDAKLWLTGFGTVFVACLSAAGHNVGIGWPFYAGMAAVAGHLAWQITTVDLEDSADCEAKFLSNKWVGVIASVGILCGKLLA